jgi:hypothetical protein
MSNYNYSYFNNNDNDEMENLDRMARELNEKKKKFDMIKEVHNDFHQENLRNKKQLEDALKDDNMKYFSINNIDNKKDNMDNMGSNINDLIHSTTVESCISDNKNSYNDSFIKSLNKYDKQNKKTNKTSKISYDSRSNNEENLSILLDELKKEHNSHIFSEGDSIVSKNEDSIIRHLKKCSKCKSKIKLVFDNNHKIKNDEDVNKNSLVIKFSDLKEYMIIILLGFLILMIIYIFFKLK